MEAGAGFSVLAILNNIASFIQGGGIIMMSLILFIWGVGLVICIERFLRISRYDVDGPSFMNEIQRYVLSNDIQGAIRVCSGSVAMLPKVLKNGLKRVGQGPEQMQNAIDATALEVIPKIELRLNYVQLIANISTLLGLLGTIFGLIASFSSISGDIDPAEKSRLLTEGISQAMNTTAMGLMSAISLMVIHAFITNKTEKIINEIDEFSVKLLDLVGAKKD